jgi:hypothetical protein
MLIVDSFDKANSEAFRRRHQGSGEFPVRVYPEGTDFRPITVNSTGGLRQQVETAISASPSKRAVLLWPK